MSLWNCTVEDGVATALYRHPPMNYFCAEGVQELAALITAWGEDTAVRAVIIGGGLPGRVITHYSVEELEALASAREDLRALGTALNVGYHGMLSALESLPKPVIAAMNGDAMGGGFELCLACDIRIAERGDYRYGLPEIKLGITPGGSGTQRLSRLMGAGRAIDFLLRGRIVPPEAALALGLVHECADDALAHARALARDMARLPPRAVARMKHAVYAGSDTHLAAGLAMEAADFLDTLMSDDGLAAMRAYLAQPLEARRDWLEGAELPPFSGH